MLSESPNSTAGAGAAEDSKSPLRRTKSASRRVTGVDHRRECDPTLSRPAQPHSGAVTLVRHTPSRAQMLKHQTAALERKAATPSPKHIPPALPAPGRPHHRPPRHAPAVGDFALVLGTELRVVGGPCPPLPEITGNVTSFRFRLSVSDCR